MVVLLNRYNAEAANYTDTVIRGNEVNMNLETLCFLSNSVSNGTERK